MTAMRTAPSNKLWYTKFNLTIQFERFTCSVTEHLKIHKGLHIEAGIEDTAT